MRNIDVLKQLSRRGKTFTVEDAAETSGMEREGLRVMLHRMEKRGWIERIERGKYIIIPLPATKGRYTLNELVIGSLLVEDHCIAYWSALHFHGLTEQIPGTVFIQTTSRKKKQLLDIFGVTYRIIRVKPEKFFGMETQWMDDDQVNITEKEKTVVDCLDKPQHCGGVIEVLKALRDDTLRRDLLLEYGNRMGNSGIIRRLGYLSELLAIDLDVPRTETRSYLYLDPTLPHKGPKVSKWKLIINMDERMLGDLE